MNIANKIIKSLLLLFCFVFIKPARAQELLYKDRHIGFNISANCAFGTHFKRFGMNFNFFYVNKFVQANSEVRVYFSFKNLGPKFIYEEVVLAQGLVLGYGTRQHYHNPFINSVSNQTRYKNSFAYSYNYYINKIKTRQVTGIAALQFNSISLIIENDILAKPILDRFRTGAFLLQYQYKNVYQAGINCTLWTGQMGKKISIIHPHVYTGCYMDTTNGVYPNLSHGLLSLQFKYNIGLGQNLQANIGVDEEQVRNAVQNRFIHNMRFIPEKWNKAKNCHIPMIDENGNQFLYKEGQKIRPPQLYWNIFSNANLFY